MPTVVHQTGLTLICRQCRDQRDVSQDATVGGRPVTEWWDGPADNLCQSCRQLATVTPKAHRPGHDTEHAAAEAAAPNAATLRAEVLRILLAHPEGLTDDEGASIIGGDRLRFGRRRNELADQGLVRDTGRRRHTPAGRQAIVWAIDLNARKDDPA